MRPVTVMWAHDWRGLQDPYAMPGSSRDTNKVQIRNGEDIY